MTDPFDLLEVVQRAAENADPGGRVEVTKKAHIAFRQESLAERRGRRLKRFKELGGDMRQAGEAWHQCGKRGALATLEREERNSGQPMCHRNDIRVDLVAASRLEAEELRRYVQPADLGE